MTQRPRPQSQLALHLYEASAFLAVAGVNEGDPLSSVSQLCAGDVYRLSANARGWPFLIQDQSIGAKPADAPGGLPTVAEAPTPELIGAKVLLQGDLCLMTPEGERVDLTVVSLRMEGKEAVQFVLPRTPIAAGEHHVLLTVDETASPEGLRDITPVAFARGTRITLSDGEQRPVEQLAAGDLLLTRDSGAQPLKWVGTRSVRAVGSCAPVFISKGFFANERDLLVSQYQRLYLPHPASPAGAQPLLVPAVDLLFEDKVFLHAGGAVEYYHLALDSHEIIYAECIPTESLLVGPATAPGLPQDLGNELPSLRHKPHAAKSLTKEERDRIDAYSFRKDHVT